MKLTANTFACQKLLIIDDAEIDRYVAERLVKKHCFAQEVLTLASATEALQYLNTVSDDANDLPQLIFLDINMPVMNGFEFLERFTALPEDVTANITIIMLTSSLLSTERSIAENNEYVQLFINKPLSAEKLEEIKESIMKRA